MDEKKFVDWAKENIKPGNAEELKKQLENVELSRRGLFGALAASVAVPSVLKAGGNDIVPPSNDWYLAFNGNFKHMVSC